jgi:anaerobic selenocysteine-containing dehydrogenase
LVTEHRSFCRICIAACGTNVRVEDDRVVSIRGDADHPLSRGYLCPKGRALGTSHHHPDRLDGVLVGRDGDRRAVGVEEGHAHLAETLGAVVQEHGLGSVGVFLGSGAFQDMAGIWAARKLRGALRTEHAYSTATVDAVAKTLVAEQMGGTPLLLPGIDEDHGRLLIFVGVNPVISHGHSTMFSDPIGRIRAAKSRGPVYALDPRATETTRLADHHLAVRPGTDYAVFAHVLRAVTGPGLDEAALAERATGLAGLRAAVAPFDRDHAAAVTGLDPAQLDGLVAAVRQAGRLAVLTGTGSTMSRPGNLTEWLVWALLVVTDSFDQPGGMWFNPGMTNRLDRLEMLPPAGPPAPGPGSRPDILRVGGEWPASLIPDEIEAGRLRALVVAGGNIMAALPDPERLERALRAIDVLVVLEVRRTATTDVANYVFACADQLERPDLAPLELHATAVYQQYTAPVVAPRDSRPPMWQTISTMARSIGLDLLGGGVDPATVDSDAMLARLARGAPFEQLKAEQAPLVESSIPYGWVTSRLPFGRWELAPAVLVDQLTTLPAPAPLVLIPRRPIGRLNSQPFRDGDRPEALVHPDDAAAAGVGEGELIDVTSATGTLRLTARVTDSVVPGSVSIQHGWEATNVNLLIDSHDLDPLTGMAHLSGTAVRIVPA